MGIHPGTRTTTHAARPSSLTSCATAAGAGLPRASACERTAAAARRGCGARRSRSSPGSGCPGTRGWSRAATSSRRPRCSTRSRACSSSTPASARHLFHLARVELPLPPRTTRSRRRRSCGRSSTRSCRTRPTCSARGPTCWPGTLRPRACSASRRRARRRPNLLWWLFTDPERRGPSWEDTARNTLARFRAEHARRNGDPGFRRLIEALRRRARPSPSCGPRHEVLDRPARDQAHRPPGAGPLRCTTCSRSRRATRTCGSPSSSPRTRRRAQRWGSGSSTGLRMCS